MLAPSSPSPTPSSFRIASFLALGALGGLAATLVAAGATAGALASQPRARAAAADPCAVALDASTLPARDRGLLARRMAACADVVHGRITASEYREAVARIDEAWAARPAPPPASPPQPQWASSVRGFSTQYTATSWAATQVLGAPDVHPGHGDNPRAWASLGADDRDEWLEVGFAQPMHASAVEVYETFNPGAVRAITLITASGERISAYQGTPGATGAVSNVLRAQLGCTAEPIVAVRVDLASAAVGGWNEIDAIGLAPCAEP